MPIRISRLDPTRTTNLRQAFARQLRKRFRKLKGMIYKYLVLDDTFGLAANSEQKIPLASTQVNITDQTVLDAIRGIQVRIAADDLLKLPSHLHVTVRYGLFPQTGLAEAVQAILRKRGLPEFRIKSLSVFEQPEEDVLKFDVQSDTLTEWNRLLGSLPNIQTYEYHPHLTVAYLKKGTGTKYVRSSAIDGMLVSGNVLDFVYSDADRNFTEITTNAPPNQFKFTTSQKKLEEFQRWLRQQFKSELLGKSNEELWLRYTQRGFERGAGRAFDDLRAAEKAGGFKADDFWNGSKNEFLKSAFGRPETREKMELLASRSFSDLANVTEDMATKMGRVLADGLVSGANPRTIAKDLEDELGLGMQRSETIARTEIIRAHSEGQLDAFERMGVEEVGVAVEWRTAGDDRVCDACAPMEGAVFKVAEAHGMIPRHPNCRCAFLPANVGEEQDEQLRSKGELKGAIKDSLEAMGQGKDDWGTDVAISTGRPISLLNALAEWEANLLARSPTTNEFDPDQPRDETGKWTSTGGGGMPSGVSQIPSETLAQLATSNLEKIKSLGGSTGATLVKDKSGQQFVQKGPVSGAKAEHIKNEGDADRAYRALGVAVPDGNDIDTMSGTMKLTKFVEGAEELGKLPPDQQKAARAELAKNFVADALLANWDVVGLNQDNILVKDGKPIRVDNGGALRYRAQGDLKGDAFGPEVKELQTMRDPSVNPQTAKVYGSLTQDEIHSQIKDVLAKKDQVLSAITHPQTKSIMEQRFKHLESMVKPPASATTSTAGNDLKSPAGLVNHIKESMEAGGVKFSELQLKKLEALNPNGIQNGVMNVHVFTGDKAANTAKMEHLKKIMPPGTVFKTKAITAAKLGIIKDTSSGKGIGGNPDPTPTPSPTPTPTQPKATPALPKTYGGLQPGHKYVNSKGETKEVHSVETDGTNVKIKFVGESGQAIVPAGKAFGFSAPSSTPTPTPKPASTPTYAPSPTPATTAPPNGWTTAPVQASSTLMKEHSIPVIENNKKLADSVTEYTGSYAVMLNDKMRKCPPDFGCLSPKDKKHANHIMNMVDAAPPFPQPVLVSRGINLGSSGTKSIIEGLLKAKDTGQEMQFPSITSTSINYGFSGNIRFKIAAKRGIYVETISMFPYEKEVILSPKQKFTVRDVVQSGSGEYHVYLEEQ